MLEKTGVNQHEIGKWNMASLGCVFNGRAERDCEVLSPVTAGWSCGHRSIAKMPESGYDLCTESFGRNDLSLCLRVVAGL